MAKAECARAGGKVAALQGKSMIEMEFIWANAAVLVAAAIFIRVRLALIARREAPARPARNQVPARAA